MTEVISMQRTCSLTPLSLTSATFTPHCVSLECGQLWSYIGDKIQTIHLSEAFTTGVSHIYAPDQANISFFIEAFKLKRFHFHYHYNNVHQSDAFILHDVGANVKSEPLYCIHCRQRIQLRTRILGEASLIII